MIGDNNNVAFCKAELVVSLRVVVVNCNDPLCQRCGLRNNNDAKARNDCKKRRVKHEVEWCEQYEEKVSQSTLL
jgi:hypothetical protein